MNKLDKKLRISIEGYVKDSKGNISSIPYNLNPTETELLSTLNLLRDAEGELRSENQEVIDNDLDGILNLRLYAKERHYMVISLENIGDEQEVRSTYNSPTVKGLSSFFYGESFPADAIINDFNIVISIFTEFIKSGNVSGELME